jgi:hypothetical protein
MRNFKILAIPGHARHRSPDLDAAADRRSPGSLETYRSRWVRGRRPAHSAVPMGAGVGDPRTALSRYQLTA